MSTRLENELLISKVEKLLNDSERLKSFFMESPIPAWHKAVVQKDGRVTFPMDFVNKAYTERTGVTAKAYKAAEDSDIWGPTTGDHFNSTDMQVVRRKGPVMSEEYAVPPGKEGKVWVGVKFPDFDRKGNLVGVWGVAVGYEPQVWIEIRDKHPLFKGTPMDPILRADLEEAGYV